MANNAIRLDNFKIPFSEQDIDFVTHHYHLALFLVLPLALLFSLTPFIVRKGPRYGLQEVPGPVLAPLSSIYRIYLLWSGEAAERFQKLHKTYGSVVRIGPSHIVVSDPSLLSTIYGQGWRFPKSDFYRVFAVTVHGETRDTVFSTRDQQYHRMMKSHVLGRYSTANLEAAEGAIEKTTGEFIAKMEKYAGEPVDLAMWLQYWAFDTNAAFDFGDGFGFLAEENDVHGIIASIVDSFRTATLIGQIPWLSRWFIENKPMWRLLERTTGAQDPTGQFVKDLAGRIEKMERNSNQMKPCLLSWFREKQNSSESDDLDDSNILIHLANFFVAGSLTAATTIGAAIYFAIQDPAVSHKVTAEVRDFQALNDAPVSITYADTLKLTYLQAVLKEAMRLTPTNNIPLERLVPAEGLSANGFHLPAGTNVGMSAYTVHRNKEIYGANADVFRPERWLNTDPASVQRMNKYFFAFGKGERGCSGRVLAMMMMGKFLAQIFLRFNIEWAGNGTMWNLKNWWMPEQHDLHVRFTPVSGFDT